MTSAVRWWEDPQVVKHRLAGVFEGGGAKGIAYVGALNATKARQCWFGAVAGASAGAITAALVASGLLPAEIEAQTDAAFARLAPGSWPSGLKRLRLHFGFLDSRGLYEWLEELLAQQVRTFGIHTEGPVTFATLYQATGIELNIVAADLSRGRQIVFSVWDTPGAQVTDSVLASSSIPFAFAPRVLRVPSGGQAYGHTVVDGGVWSNFPMFVFNDRSFRSASNRNELVAEEHIVGYLLHEVVEEDHSDFAQSYFVGLAQAPEPVEWSLPSVGTSGARVSMMRRLIRWFLIAVTLPLAAVVRLGSWLSLGNDPAWKGRWPLRSSIPGYVLRRLDDGMAALYTLWLAVPVFLAVTVGTWGVMYVLGNSILASVLDSLRVSMLEGPPHPLAIMLGVLGLITGGLIVTLGPALALTGLAGNYLLLGPARHVMYGLLRTYAAGPGAPAWAGRAEGDHVLRLPIPRELTTLSFRRTPAVATAMAKAIEDAYAVTSAGLDSVLSSPAIEGPPRPPAPHAMAPAASPTSPSGAGPMFAVRLVIVAGLIAVVLFGTSLVLPKPLWYRYGVHLAVCAEELIRLGENCEEAGSEGSIATVIFDSASTGRLSEATLSVDDKVIERAPRLVTSPGGRLIPFTIDWVTLCKARDCRVTIHGLVDGRSVYHWTLNRTATVTVEGRENGD